MTEHIQPFTSDDSEPEVEAHVAPVLGLQEMGVDSPQPPDEAWGSSYSFLCTPHEL